MSETVRHDLRHLPAAAASLGHVFARPKVLAGLCVIVLAGLGWLYLALLLAGTDSSPGDSGLSRPCAVRCKTVSWASTVWRSSSQCGAR